MRILFDLTNVNPNNMSGFVVFSFRLLNGFKQLQASDEIVLLVTKENQDFIKKIYPEFSILILTMKESGFLKRLHFLRGFVHKKALNAIIEKNNISILFSPSLHMGSLYTTVTSQIGVLHDAQTYIFFKDQGFKGILYKLFTIRLLRRMSHIVTISNYAKSSISKEIPLLKAPISVIYNSVEIFQSSDKIHFKQYAPYILFVNTLMPYKNLETLVRAFAILKESIEHSLVIKAKRLPYWDEIILPLLKKHEIEDRVFLITENYSDEKLAALYHEADLFVSPSKMEGFGFTPIEAAMHEIPVISSKESALYETTMGLLNYYEPVDDFNVLAKKISDVLIDNNQKDNLFEISNKFKEVYSTLVQAESFLKLFKKIMRKKL